MSHMHATSFWAALAAGAAISLIAAEGRAQTWVGARTTPALTEIVAIDATGEEGWLYGQEDLAGDGLGSFKQQEQSIDVRTAYASTDAARFWVRIYVSDPNAVGGNIAVYVFVDSDASIATGGPAIAPEIDPKFTADPSTGGYEHVLGIQGNGSISNVWDWIGDAWTPLMPPPDATQAEAESGQDTDPIQINGVAHGYLQGVVDLDLVGLTQACNANLFIRSVNTSGAGDGDLEVGKVAPCIPADANDDDVPDVIVPVEDCTSDDQCPDDGICVGGDCILAIPCLTDADCEPAEFCGPGGNCLPDPGADCTTTEECGDLVCVEGVCNACTPGGAECGPGYRCAPTGRCVADTSTGSGPPLGPGEQVQGGAFACSTSPRTYGGAAALFLAGAGLAVARRRRRRS
jgi:MYXO-CTERM domain-containing protein